MIAGGHCTFNPEPLADFVDVFALGDGEEIVGDINEAVHEWLALPRRRARPDDTAPGPGGHRGGVRPVPVHLDLPRRTSGGDGPNRPDVPAEVAKRTVADLADWPYPVRPLVPLTEVVHDRLNVEVFRGCTRGLPLLPGGDDHPARARAPGGTGQRDGQ